MPSQKDANDCRSQVSFCPRWPLWVLLQVPAENEEVFKKLEPHLHPQGCREGERTKDELNSEVETRYASHQSLLKTNNRANDRKLRRVPHSVCVYAQTGNQYVKGQSAFLRQRFLLTP